MATNKSPTTKIRNLINRFKRKQKYGKLMLIRGKLNNVEIKFILITEYNE